MTDEYERMLYIFGNHEYGWYKIGISNHPVGRHYMIQTDCPVPLEIVLVAETGRAAELEQTLHRRYAGKCIGREWFALNKEDIDYIARIAPGWDKAQWEQDLLPGFNSAEEDIWRGFLGEWFCEKHPELV